MTRLVATLTCWTALAAVVVVSGGYSVHYLLTWQWGRAEFAATAFVASLVVGAAFLVLVHLRRMEERLERRLAALSLPGSPPADVSPADAPAPTASGDDEPRPHFTWLSTSRVQLAAVPLVAVTVATSSVPLEAPRPSVFIPVFLATGLVVSALAAGVERLAARRTGLRAPGGGARWNGLGLVAVAAAVVTATVLGGLYWTSHYWGGPLGPGTTTFEVEVRHQGSSPGDPAVAATAGRLCSLDEGVDTRFRDVRRLPDGHVRVRVSPALDGDAVVRFGGCLQDAILERHRLVVHDVRAVVDRRR
jgi:MFS family permease